MVSRHVACCCHLLDISQCYRMYLKKWLIAIYSGFMLLYFLHFPSVSGRNTIKRKTHISVYLWSKRKIRHFSCKHIETESNSIFECESFLNELFLLSLSLHHVISFTRAVPTKATSNRLQ